MITTDQKMTQRDLVLKFIEDKGKITAMDAFFYLGITQLAARICELEKLGYAFTKTPVKKKGMYGNTVRYIEYRIWEDWTVKQ